MKRSSSIPAFFMFCILLLAILACQPVGAPPTAAPTEPPPPVVVDTAAPVDTVAPPPTEPVAEQYFTEQFDNESGNWSHFVVDASIKLTSPGSLASVAPGDVGNMSLKVSDGRLVFDLENKGLWVYTTYDGYDYGDVRLDVVVENRGTNDNNVSLVCRYSKEEGWYEFNLANNGLYDILYGRYTPDNKIVYSRLANGGSNKIKQGKEINNYSITCKGRTLLLNINGFETRRMDDNQYVLRKGKVGVSVSSFNTLPVKVEFELDQDQRAVIILNDV